MSMFEKIFHLNENGTNLRTELLAGLTTFLTMAYIICLQPAILSGSLYGTNTGMDFGAVMTGTCISAVIATVIMALYARYPIALAPGMGENFFFVFSAVPAAAAAGFTNSWQVALGTVFISGVLFMLLSVVGAREALINAVSPSMKNGIAVGIGLFIAFIGLQNAHIIIPNPGTAVKLNPEFASPDVIIFLVGLIVTASLHARRVKGSILWGIIITCVLAVILKSVLPHMPEIIAASKPVKESLLMTQLTVAHHIFAMPPSVKPVLFKMDIVHACSAAMIPFIIIFLFMAVFDTMGTLIGVAEQAGFMKNNQLPRANRALMADAIGTATGACFGNSTVTCYIESAAGVEQGGRTGLTALVVAGLFLGALFFSPIVKMIGSYAPITAPALVIVGFMMIQNIRKIDWADYSEAIPSFITVIGIPLAYSVADGLAIGFITYPFIKLVSGKRRELRWPMVLIGAAFLLYFILVRERW
ncbi:MAG: NCS2 family permease [Kiritimatiellia bacterium]|nr:NCS2 family permease [Kiritimatiellia bacterium]